MDSLWLRRGLLALAILVAVVCVAALLVPNDEPAPQMEAGQQAPDLQTETSDRLQGQGEQKDDQSQVQRPMYEMGIWEGKVAVFLPGTDHPMRITEMPVTSLPNADQAALEARIPVYDGDELASFLEDYGS